MESTIPKLYKAFKYMTLMLELLLALSQLFFSLMIIGCWLWKAP